MSRQKKAVSKKSSPKKKATVVASSPWSKVRSFLTGHRRDIFFYTQYFIILTLASYLFYRRFPNSYSFPNFYAEDGRDFAKNLINTGFFRSLGTTFNGYYIWGIYILEQIGLVVNRLFFSGEFANIPRSFSIVSYCFLGFTATLPLLLFRKYFKSITLLLIILLSIFVPLPGSDYAVIGTIGNLKFAFIYIAFLLLVYRHLMPANSKKVYLIDVGLLICAYTNITVYPMMLFALVRYIPQVKGKDFYKSLLKDRSFQSLIVLGIAMLPQLYIVKHYGVPELKGYLDAPYNFARTIEIFVSRSYLYGILFPVNKLLNDFIVCLVFAFIFFVGVLYPSKHRKVFLFGIFSVFLATFLFAVKRTGISDSFLGYKDGGPDQFFYTQNLIFYFIFILVLTQIVDLIKNTAIRRTIYTGLILVVVFWFAPKANSTVMTGFEQRTVGDIYSVSQQACKTDPDNSIDIPVYPAKILRYTDIQRSDLCTPLVMQYQSPILSLGLAPHDNTYIAGLGSVHTLDQTFVSPENNLNGVSVYFSTFTKTVRTPYTFTLLSEDCKNVLLKTAIHTSKIKDNAFYRIAFPSISDSANKGYCFTINSDNKDAFLAIQMSQPNAYPTGVAILDNQTLDSDLVFELNYGK